MPDADNLGNIEAQIGAVAAAATGREEGDVPSDDGANTDDFYVGTWKDREAAERGLREQRAALTKAQQEAAELRKEHGRLQETILAKLTEATAKANQPAPAQAKEVDWDSLAKQIDEQPSKALEITQAWMKELDAGAKGYVETKTKTIESELATLRDTIAQLSPEYQQHKAVVEQIKAATKCSTQQALELAKTIMKATGPAQPNTPTPPSAIRNDVGGYGDDVAGDDPTHGGLLQMLVPDLKPEELKRLRRRKR